MKKYILVSLFFLLIGALLLGACSSPEPEPVPSSPTPSTPVPSTPTPGTPAPGTPTPSTPAPSTPAPAEEPIELSFSSSTPGSAPMSQNEQKMFDLITERTGGRVIITPYWASSLLPVRENWPGLLSGIADILHWSANEDYCHLNWGIVHAPFIGWPTMEAGGEIMNQLVEEFPELKAEYQGAMIFPQRMMPPVQLHTVTKQVVAPEDVAGMKIFVTGSNALLLDSLGATPVDMTPGDMYTSLESGMIEGVVNHWPVVAVFGTLPLYNYHTNFGPGGNMMIPMSIAVNPETWASLPADIQKIFYDTHMEIFVEEGLQLDHNEIDKYVAEAEEAGHGIVNLTPEQIKVWEDAAKPIQDSFIEELEDYGPAKQILERAKELIAEYE